MLVSKISSNWTICSEGCTGKTLKKSKFHINGPLWGNRLMWIEMMGLTRASNSESVFMSWLDHDYGMNSLQISLFLFPWAIVKEIISISSLCALPKSIYIYIYTCYSIDVAACNPITPVECVSLSFRTHPCVLAFITYILCTNQCTNCSCPMNWTQKSYS